MPSWNDSYEALMSEALVGSPFDTPEEVQARIDAREKAQREWDARPWYGKAWHSSFETKLLALFWAALVFLLVDGLSGTNEHVVATCSSKLYTAQYTRRESVLHGKIHRDEDVTHGPYWQIWVQFPNPRPPWGRVEMYYVDPATFDKWEQGGPINMVWRKGRWTGIWWNSWIGEKAEAQQ